MDFYISILKKDGTNERYVVSCTDETLQEALRTLGQWASEPELTFTWKDAARMTGQLLEKTHE